MLAVVVPCYNEEEVIEELVSEFQSVRERLEFDLIFVNDGSTDETGERIRESLRRCDWIRIVTHESNQGIAKSLKDGFFYALKEGYAHIAHMDSDLTHPPSLLPKMMEEITDADLVIAGRYVPGGGMKGVPGWRVMISRGGNWLFRLFLRIKTRDATSGYRLAKREVFENLPLESDSFGIQLEITVKAERAGFRIREVPFVLTNRKKGVSKFRLRYLFGYIPLVLKLMVGRGGRQ
ncbi:MAG: glycosyltransferase [Candidatus Hydrothermarchaeales archaeon]